MTRDDYNPDSFDDFQQEAIRHALKNNIDIIPYLNISYHSDCINQIALGLEHRIDVTPYAKPEYSWRKMKEIRLGIEQRLDISNYANPLYSYWQMREIRLGLAKGLDVDEYKSLMYTAKEMKKRRLWLLKHQKSVHGLDGYYDFRFQTKINKMPMHSDDSSIDFDNINWFEPVTKGQILAIYHASTQTSDERTANGEAIPAVCGKEKPILTGSGFELLSDKKTYVSTKNGHVRLHRYEMTVSDLVVLDRLSPSDESFCFDCDVYIKGSVTGPVTINVNGDLVIDGFVNDAEIHCSGTLVLKSGINASSVKNSITVNGNVICKFFEYTTLHADGNIFLGSSLNSNLSSYGEIVSYGKKGGIIGGFCYAEKGFCLANIGNSVGVNTTLLLGTNENIRLEQMILDKEIIKIKASIMQLTKTYEEVCKKMREQKKIKNDLFLKLKDAIYLKNQELESAHKEADRLKKRKKRACSSKIIVEHHVYDNVNVQYMDRKITAIPSKNVAILINEDHLVMKKIS